MKFVGLISGGKDSMYALGLAVEQGHECVCVASLYAETERDSYMFQSAGTNLVEAIARAIEKPLIVRKLRGGSVSKEMHYVSAPSDEIEDLVMLLREAKWRFPEVQAVVSGAVLSDYQRLRVEHVCRELGLVAVAPLWRKDQSELLGEIVGGGFDAVIVKISAIGLNPSHLNRPVSELVQMFEGLHKKFGFNVCGEGGEYETLMLDAPFFKKRLVIQEVIVHAEEYSESFPAAHLSVIKAGLIDKTTGELEQVECVPTIPSVPIFHHADYFSSGEITASGMGYLTNSIEEEAFLVLKNLKESLEDLGLSLAQVYYAQVYLSDMREFARFNSVYAAFFGFHSPPARFCIQLSQDVRLKILVQGSTLPKHNIQVSSVSSWAPAAIGPYSQSSKIDESLHMAGMIPLDPLTMEISSEGLTQTFRSLSRVAELEGFVIKQPQVCVVYYTSSPPALSPDLFPCYVKVTGLPKNCDHEVELHLCKFPPTTVTSSFTETNLKFTIRVSLQKSLFAVYSTWIIEVDSLSDTLDLLTYLRSQLELHMKSAKHISATRLNELLDSRQWRPQLTDYVTQVRVYDPDPYRYKQDWLTQVPCLYLHSESRVILVRLEDSWQLATQAYISSAD